MLVYGDVNPAKLSGLRRLSSHFRKDAPSTFPCLGEFFGEAVLARIPEEYRYLCIGESEYFQEQANNCVGVTISIGPEYYYAGQVKKLTDLGVRNFAWGGYLLIVGHHDREQIVKDNRLAYGHVAGFDLHIEGRSCKVVVDGTFENRCSLLLGYNASLVKSIQDAGYTGKRRIALV